jgi:tetratricopeptide (TPR) repeat protein
VPKQFAMKTIAPLLLFIVLSIGSFAQQTAKDMIAKGVELHDNGDYKAALEQYFKALELEPKSDLANYEVATTYFAMKDYDKAIDYSRKVIDARSVYSDGAYIMEGSALDIQGKAKQAIGVYKKGIAAYPSNHLLYYNLALTQFNQKDYSDIEENLRKALEIKSTHASSHLLLGYVMEDKGRRVPALLAFYNFLLLEPQGSRAVQVYTAIQNLFKKGITKSGDKNINISVSTDKEDEFSSTEMMLSLLGASDNLEKNEGKTESRLFIDKTTMLFGLLKEDDKKKGFWWNFYVNFYSSLMKAGHGEAFANYVCQSGGDKAVTVWLKDNTDKMDAFAKWYSGFDRKF